MLFNRAGISPSAIDIVYATHWHGDHLFGLRLFEDAEWLMAADGIAEWRARAPDYRHLCDRFQPAEDALPAGVTLLPAPGHTSTLAALRVETRWGPLIIAGDAVMNREYFAAEEGYRNSVDFDAAADTIRHIKAEAALVIPGHDNLILNLRGQDQVS
jgi:glyoxylase-like metal-dependent hydrolase (beta-lactamase superfamily II)